METILFIFLELVKKLANICFFCLILSLLQEIFILLNENVILFLIDQSLSKLAFITFFTRNFFSNKTCLA